MKQIKFSNNNHNLVAANSVWLINQLILWKVSLELLKFSAPTQILDMLNTLHLTIADFYLRDFTNISTLSLRCCLLPPWPSCTSFSLFPTFSPFWPCVPAEEIFGQVGPPCILLPLWHTILHFTSALTNAQLRDGHHVRSSLHLQYTSTFSVVPSLAAKV